MPENPSGPLYHASTQITLLPHPCFLQRIVSSLKHMQEYSWAHYKAEASMMGHVHLTAQWGTCNVDMDEIYVF